MFHHEHEHEHEHEFWIMIEKNNNYDWGKNRNVIKVNKWLDQHCKEEANVE